MAKIDIRAALTQSGIRCEYEGNPGKAVLLTQDIIDGARADDDGRGPSVRGGDIIVSYLEGGRAIGKKLFPEADNDLVLVLDDEEYGQNRVPVGSAADLISAVRSVSEIKDGAEGVSARAVRDADAIRSYADYLFNVGLDRRDSRTPEMRTFEFSYKMEASRTNDENGLTGEQLDLINKARSLREAIGRVNPEHPDAIAPAENGIRGRSDRAHEVYDRIEGLGYDVPPRIDARVAAQMYQVGQDLSKQVFGAMTTTPVSSLLVHPVSHAAYQKLQQEMDDGRVEGGFRDVIEGRLVDIFDYRMPGYADRDNLRLDLFTGGGADFLLVKDQAGYYVYGWNTENRVLELPEENLLILGEADVPTREEIDRLREVYDDLRYDAGADPEFGAFGIFGNDNDPEAEGDQDLYQEVADMIRQTWENQDSVFGASNDDGPDLPY